jgi:hypothetical protein
MSVLIALLVLLEEGSYAEGSNLIAGFKSSQLKRRQKAGGREQKGRIWNPIVTPPK